MNKRHLCGSLHVDHGPVGTLLNWGLIGRLDPLVVADDGGRGQVGGRVDGGLGALDDLGQGGVLTSLGNGGLSRANGQSLLGSEQSSDLLLRVDSQTGVVSPEIASIVRVLGNIVGKGILGDKGLGLATRGDTTELLGIGHTSGDLGVHGEGLADRVPES